MSHTVFKLPAELIIEILSAFADPRHLVLSGKRGGGPVHAEWLAVIRKLTMTCWHLRNMLFPLLWEYIEARTVLDLSPPSFRAKNDLYVQCAYLMLNPIVCTYVRCV